MATATLQEVDSVSVSDQDRERVPFFSDGEADRKLAQLPERLVSRLGDYIPEQNRKLSQRALRYVAWALKPEEIEIIFNMPGYRNPLDVLSIAVINHMSPDVLEKYGRGYVHKDEKCGKEYARIHNGWRLEEKGLLWAKQGYEPTFDDVEKDWQIHHNSARCRAFIVMRRREIMKRWKPLPPSN
jgi:hypothetical protein